jgi:hypothetical protein
MKEIVVRQSRGARVVLWTENLASRHHHKITMSILRHHFVSRILALRPRVLLSKTHLSSSSVRRKDPWSLPHTPEHIASTASPATMPPPKPLPRAGESIETTRARLVYQSRKRGTLESDLLLSTFAQEHLGTMNAEELFEFDKVRSSVLVPVSCQDKCVLYSYSESLRASGRVRFYYHVVLILFFF